MILQQSNLPLFHSRSDIHHAWTTSFTSVMMHINNSTLLQWKLKSCPVWDLILTFPFLTDSSDDMQRLEKPILLLYDVHKI